MVHSGPRRGHAMPDPSPRPPAIRFGVFEVDLRSGELRRNGLKIKLQEQPFQILAMLLEHPGELVTREEIQKRLWSEDTFVDFEHSLATAIKKLREALGDSADNPRFVETLPRRGYRFIAPADVGAGLKPAPTVAPVSPPATDVGATRGVAQGEAAPRPYKVLALALGFVAVALAAVLALNVAGLRDRILRRAVPTKTALPPLRAVPFTSFPGREITPSFSPDGNQIAFAWNGEKEDNWDIYVKVIGTESVLRLTTNPAADRAPAWSPDGRYIAFYRSTESGDEIYLVPALGGPEQRLYSPRRAWVWGYRPPNLSWSPDGKYLALADSLPGQEKRPAIFLLSIATREARAVTSPPGSTVTWDSSPAFAPDGRTLAFVRGSTSQPERICLAAVTGGEPRCLTPEANILGLTWTPDGAHLVYSSDRAGPPGLWKLPASGGEPEQLAVGRDYALRPTLSRDGRRLAYVHVSADANIWRFEISRLPGRSKPPTRLIASTWGDGEQQFSPDGKRIVFSSSRSGTSTPEIWLCDSDGSNAVQLTNFGGPVPGTPRWSPDGRQIAFDFFTAPAPAGPLEIYVVNADGGPPRRLTSEKSSGAVPSWSRDGRWIYFVSDRTGTWQVWKMSADGGKAVQVTKGGGFAAFESLDGKMLYYAKGLTVPGLWKVPVEGGEEIPVIEQLDAGLWGYWDLTKDGIYFYDAKTRAIEFFSFATRKLTKVAVPERGPIRFNQGLSVSPDGRWILYAQNDIIGGDIMLVENFRW